MLASLGAVAVLLVAVIVAVVALAEPAAAHGGPGGEDAPATNYLTRLLAVEPAVPGLRVRVIESGSRIELVNRTGGDVVVVGYEGEPYLRVGADGVFTNRRSPATYLNADREGGATLPADVDAGAEPEWQRVGDGPTARWHDHRVHWMSRQDPPEVVTAPGRRHVVVPAWEVPLLVDGEAVSLTGDLVWLPGPRPLPWYLAAAAAASVVGAAVRARWADRALVTAASVLALATVVGVAGVWQTSATSTVDKAGGLVTPIGCGFAAVAGLWLVRRGRPEGYALVGAAGAGIALSFGAADLDWLRRSQLPTAYDVTVARAAVAASLGVGAGIAAHAAAAILRTGSRGTSKAPSFGHTGGAH